ncbi:hypothetical protein ACOSQ3_010708 [Xanthoceras sorbifolium]
MNEFINQSPVINMPTLCEQKFGVSKQKNGANDHHQFLDLKNQTKSRKHQRKTTHHENFNSNSQVINVPFSWEIKPGVSKLKKLMTPGQEGIERWHLTLDQLPSPPCPPSKGSRANNVYANDQDQLQVPLYLCPFQSPMSKRVVGKKEDDPFLVAYRKCTELYGASGKLSSDQHHDYGKIDARRSKKIKMMKNMSMYVLSCKYSCAVTTDTSLRMSQRPDQQRRKGAERIR